MRTSCGLIGHKEPLRKLIEKKDHSCDQAWDEGGSGWTVIGQKDHLRHATQLASVKRSRERTA